MEDLRKRLILSGVLIFLIISLGTSGFIVIEGWNFLDALYMTIITLTTVGYSEVHPLTTEGRIFNIFLIIGGVGTVFYALSTGAKLVLEGELQELFGRKRLEKKIKEMNHHYVICGYGRMGTIICRELKAKKQKFVVVEKKPEKLQDNEDVLVMEGDATQDAVLKDAGIEKARGLISVLPTDAENLFVVLSARGLNPDLLIVARAVEEGSEQKLRRAGADRVISPYYIGGLRIAHTVLKPAVVDFIEFATKSGNIDLQMEEVTIVEDSKLVGLTLDESGIGRDLGIIIVAIRRNSGEMKFNPTSRITIKAGDTLIALGEIPKLAKLEEMSAAEK
ncbi:MAG: potassium channel protein [Nitrospirae bacterium]|nr:potassium channel protein [Nitrospirota bacterium]